MDLKLSSRIAKTMLDRIFDFKVREQALDQDFNEQYENSKFSST